LKTESEEHLKPKSQYAEEAVQLALSGRWEQAADVNRFILESFGADQEAQNRLGKALTELGRLDEAKASYEASLQLNPLNMIARKNAAKLDVLLRAKDGLRSGPAKVDLNLFVEEMGKTMVTVLEAVGPDVCRLVVPGDVAELRIERDGIVAETVRGVRLGMLEARLARRLIKFIKGGNRYQAGVTGCEGDQVRMIVRETHQDPRFVGKPSFPMRRKREVDFRPYTKESLLAREVESYEEDGGEEREEGEDTGDSEIAGLHPVEDEAEPLEDFGGQIEAGDEDEEDER